MAIDRDLALFGSIAQPGCVGADPGDLAGGTQRSVVVRARRSAAEGASYRGAAAVDRGKAQAVDDEGVILVVIQLDLVGRGLVRELLQLFRLYPRIK